MTIEEIKEILRIVDEGDFTEFELERDGLKIRVARRPSAPDGAPPAPAPASLPSAAPRPALPAGATPPTESGIQPPPGQDEGLTTVASPIVGTFYRSPDPSSTPFVNVGDRVTVGQVLCIVEAMKLMNEIEAELVGEIVKVHPENGQPVQYGDPLFSLRTG